MRVALVSENLLPSWGETALLARAGDAAMLTRLIASRLREYERRKRMSVAGRTWAEQREWPIVLDRLLEAYQQIITVGHLASASLPSTLSRPAIARPGEDDQHATGNVA
jgi:hypothetical protein